jgi:multicomponent Na+:H+ antiporter subunit B
MRTLIFRTAAPTLTSLMLLFSVFVLLRGHNEPGGGFIGGLIAVAAFAIQAIAFGVPEVRRAMRVHPMTIAGCGLLLSALSGLVSVVFRVPFLSGLWWSPSLFGVTIDLSTVLFFDIGVYLVVVGALGSIALALEDREER